MYAVASTLCEQLHEDIELLDAAGWSVERVRSELSHEEIEEMVDAYVARSDDAVAGALSAALADH